MKKNKIDSSSPARLVLEKMCHTVFKAKQLVFFILDKTGRILDHDGNIKQLGFKAPESGSDISQVVPFMEGILPLKSRTMKFSCIRLSRTRTADALLFRTDDGYGLIIWNTSEENGVLENVFTALNAAVLEMDANGHFVLIGTPPDWIEHIFDAGLIRSGTSFKEDVFSFLGSFIHKAKDRWAKNQKETFKSGIWVEKDDTGQENNRRTGRQIETVGNPQTA